MSDTAIFIFGMFVFATVIGASLIATIGTSRPGSRGRELEKNPIPESGAPALADRS